MPESEELIPPVEAARRLGITVRTLHRWEKAGLITSRRTPFGHRRYSPTDVDKLLTRSEPKAAS